MPAAMPIFDTLKYANTLKAAGIPEAHAQAEARALADAMNESTYNLLATKSDIAEVRKEIADVKASLSGEITGLKVDMADLRSDLKLVKWVAVTTAAGVLSQIARGFM